MTKVYHLKYQTLTLNENGTFTLEHVDMGYGMHDATRREQWTANGKFTQNGNSVTLDGHRKGATSGSRTNMSMRRVEHYTNPIDDTLNLTIDLTGWSDVKQKKHF